MITHKINRKKWKKKKHIKYKKKIDKDNVKKKSYD